jgi:predicted GNAT family acetyltransferase
VNAAAFLDAAGPLLLEDEARHNLLLGIAGVVRDAPDQYAEARFWLVDGAAAMQTPPHNLILAKPRDDAALAALAAAIDSDLPGVTGAVPEVHAFAALWSRPATQVFAQWIYELDRVVPPPPARGAFREADESDAELAFEWFEAFAAEALHGETIERRQIEARLRSAAGGIALWEDEDRTVSLCGYGSPTPNGIRIGPVYTPPELRGRGYATSLTAEASQRLLDRGRRFCFLYTDAANPTSNAIYERIGYRKVCESAMLAFA